MSQSAGFRATEEHDHLVCLLKKSLYDHGKNVKPREESLGSRQAHIRYLRGTKDMQLTFRSRHPTEVEGYTDSHYVENPNNE